jgi:hypothetical protein
MTVTTVGKNLVRDGTKGTTSTKLLYFAVGTDNTAPAAGNTKLGTEVFRKAVSSYTNGASTGEILVNCYLAPGDAVGVSIAEVGVFGGNAASSAANSGVLLARGLYSHTKTNIESITLQLDLTFA